MHLVIIGVLVAYLGMLSHQLPDSPQETKKEIVK